MQMINVHEAKTHLSKLRVRVSAGEEIIIAKAGKPLARLVAWKEPVLSRKPGLDSERTWGQIFILDNAASILSHSSSMLWSFETRCRNRFLP